MSYMQFTAHQKYLVLMQYSHWMLLEIVELYKKSLMNSSASQQLIEKYIECLRFSTEAATGKSNIK